ncbi:LysE family translocator [Rhizobacter sp. Root404]|uniref:LysE family translocator n=1 Tax=Rhizobacter sp. Root404 TaxID=1736528 RepID=UPI0009EB718F|nr:LysE family translocator [Rhizobacter sp. Root404]
MADSLVSMVAYCAIMSGTPGPNNVMLANSGANFGYRRTLPYLLGICAGVFAITVLVCTGLGAVFTAYPVFHSVLKVAGAAYLGVLAWKIANSSGTGEGATAKAQGFADGALFQLVNPKSWLKAVTLATLFMPANFSLPTSAIIVAIVGLAVAFPLLSCWACFGVVLRRFLTSPLRLRIFNVATGLSLFVLAITILF